MTMDPVGPLHPLDVRIGDAERDDAARRLTEHYAAGRLDVTEFQQRLDAVFAARTTRNLLPVFRDLPPAGGYPPPPPAPVRTPVARRAPAPIPVFLVLVLAFVGLSFALGFPPLFLFPLLWIWHGSHRRRAWH